MDRTDLQRLSKEELIELVMRKRYFGLTFKRAIFATIVGATGAPTYVDVSV
jgi:hypothetical protein